MNLLAKTAPSSPPARPGPRAATTFTNGDLVVTYAIPSGITDTDARIGEQITVRATYHQDLLIPLIGDLLPQGCRRAAEADRRSHDGHQLMADDLHAARARGRQRARSEARSSSSSSLSITVLFAAAGLAFDIGRFYSERRFLQNAADAAALAAANALIRGDTDAQATREAMTS